SVVSEEAGDELAVGSEAGACAVTAKRLGDGGDDTDFSPVFEFIIHGRRAWFPAALFGQPKMRPKGGKNFFFRDDFLHVPAIRVPDVHKLDVTDGEAVRAREFRKRHDFLFVHAALNHRIELDGE